ncbi:hypothetical protein CYLTODRAFT_423189 [Cylindrobasidium torrendii FP15055 ss-10]|uniref:Peptidase S54 rhomboid domain-containing protein n=1 Tax=Cylindrobasidium torrendii FP15055 ss-10 TaxID=1314674 RepID=A0A0D7B849_9AGAR|nr:hypothetical protein CYLTODRAFT_423189 [Cylindrobasidium torrendii FP15055 ss-10]
MSFENAPVSKALLATYTSCTLLVSVFDINIFLNAPSFARIRLEPWRLFTQTTYAPSSPALLCTLALCSRTAPVLERRMGSHKFLSLVALVWMLGPIGVSTALAVIHSALVPPAYHYKIFGIPLGEGWLWKGVLLGFLCFLTSGGVIWGGLGAIAGMLWTMDVAGMKGFRVGGGQRATAWISQAVGGSGIGVRRARAALPSETQRAESQ